MKKTIISTTFRFEVPPGYRPGRIDLPHCWNYSDEPEVYVVIKCNDKGYRKLNTFLNKHYEKTNKKT